MPDTKHIDLFDLISQDVQLKRVASTNGGEFAGPCPWCGGNDRFRVWPFSDKPRYWCRQCNHGGDAIQYLRDLKEMTYQEACSHLGVLSSNGQHRPLNPKTPSQPNPNLARRDWEALTNPEWQQAANDFVDQAFDVLHSKQAGLPGRHYLQQQRKLTNAVMTSHALGFNVQNYRARWGGVDVFIPANSIIIPWLEKWEHWNGSTWVPAKLLKVKYRRIDQKKYGQATGGADGLYDWPYFRPGATVVLVEGELCALSLRCAAPGLTIPLATGSVTGARLYRWIARLALAKHIFLAFDNDDEGEKAAQWWQKTFPTAIRLKPTRHDINDMLTAGDDIKMWVNSATQASV